MTSTNSPADAPAAPADNHPYHAMAWDSKRGVLWKAFGSATVGGDTGNCGDCGVNDTYKLDTTTGQGLWTETCGNTMAACPPGALQESTLAYDPVHDTLLLYGGLSGGTPSADTWEYTPLNDTWTKICGLNASPQPTCGPPQLDAPGLVYDAALGQFVLFGGATPPNGSPLNTTTWLYNVVTHSWAQANTVTNPPSMKFPVMDYIPRLAAVALIGSEPTGAHTWSFNGSQWSDLNVNGGPVMSTDSKQNQGAYDVSSDRFVLFLPGSNGTSGSIWSLALPSSVPPPIPGPAVTLSQASVSFPAQAVGTVSSAESMALTSTGTAALTINGISITGTDSGDFSQTSTCPASRNTLAVGAKCTISFTFKPSKTGAESALVNISDNAASGSPQVAALSGIGTAAGAVVTLSPTSLNFGSQALNTTSAPQTLTLTSSSAVALTINSVTITGNNSADFSQTNNCPISTATLAVGGSCAISVTFTPSGAASETAAVSVSDNAAGSPQNASLNGAGVSSSVFSISALPSSATVSAGQSASYTVTVTPSGGAFNNAVSLSCSNLPPATSCAFSPNSVTPGANPASSKLTIATTASSSLHIPARGPRGRWPSHAPSLTLGALCLLALSFLLWRGTRRRLIEGFAIVILCGLVALQTGCAGLTSAVSLSGTPGTPAGTSNITVTANGGSQQKSVTVTLVVQ